MQEIAEIYWSLQ